MLPENTEMPPKKQGNWTHFPGSTFNLTGHYSEIKVLTNARVLGRSALILGEDGKIDDDSLNEPLYWAAGPFPLSKIKDASIRELIITERKKMLQRLADTIIDSRNEVINHVDHNVVYLCHPFGWYAFGHLHDTLQRLYQLRETDQLLNCKFVVSDYRRVIDFKLHLSALAGRDISDDDLICAKKHDIHVFPRLTVPSSPAIPTNYTSDSLEWLTSSYFSKFPPQTLNTKNTRGIYLSRNHIQPGKRGVTNEEEVISFLETKGFAAITGKESLAEIISLFHNAKWVIGPHGSLFANTIFCRSDARIIEFCPHNRPDYSFRDKNKLAHQYRHIAVKADSSYNINIPLETLKQELLD